MDEKTWIEKRREQLTVKTPEVADEITVDLGETCVLQEIPEQDDGEEPELDTEPGPTNHETTVSEPIPVPPGQTGGDVVNGSSTFAFRSIAGAVLLGLSVLVGSAHAECPEPTPSNWVKQSVTDVVTCEQNEMWTDWPECGGEKMYPTSIPREVKCD